MAGGVRRLISEMEELQKLARRIETPEGAMEWIMRELPLYGELIREFANVHKIYQEVVGERISIHPAVLAAIEGLWNIEMKVAAAADAVSPLAQKLEQKRIEALNDPRNAVWDVRANQGYTG